jgi:hypothetical protein
VIDRLEHEPHSFERREFVSSFIWTNDKEDDDAPAAYL